MGCSASRPITFSSGNGNPEDHSSVSVSSSAVVDSSDSSPSFPRAFSLSTPLIHHPPLRKGDTHHLVSLVSTTYGSLLLVDHPKSNGLNFNRELQPRIPNPADSERTFSPDSVINTWELMDGLDDDLDPDSGAVPNPYLAVEHQNKPGSNTAGASQYMGFERPATIQLKTVESEDALSPSSSVKPLWQHLSEEALLAKLDPNVVFSYRRALSSKQLGSNRHPEEIEKSVSFNPPTRSVSNSWFHLPRPEEDKVVIYFTSLRGIRKTYEDCCLIRTIFRSFRIIPVDERDISMDSSYRNELQTALAGKIVNLPQVFIRGKYIGGAEEIKQLNEFGELGKLLMGFPVWDEKKPECKICGEVRFLPCSNCFGSRKVYEEEEGELKRCPKCNENGLIKCPGCCS